MITLFRGKVTTRARFRIRFQSSSVGRSGGSYFALTTPGSEELEEVSAVAAKGAGAGGPPLGSGGGDADALAALMGVLLVGEEPWVEGVTEVGGTEEEGSSTSESVPARCRLSGT